MLIPVTWTCWNRPLSFSGYRRSAPIPARKLPRARRCFSFSTDDFRSDIGALWENWVIAEVAKHNALLGSPAELFFWRTRAQSEVDLVVKQGSSLRAFEVTWSSRRISGRAFRDAYGVELEPIRPENPFAVDIVKT